MSTIVGTIANQASANAASPSSAGRSAVPLSLPWIEKLIGFDTTSRESNLGLIETVRDYLKQAGIDAVLTHDAAGRKANLFATVPAHDGHTDGGIVLSGHTDVVPVNGQPWDTDPFKAVVKDGKLYGRGACDMKGFIGVSLALLPEMQAARLKQPLHFALSYDEEVGCVGAPVMLADLKRRGIRLDGCIVGEPTTMRPIVAHKGINAYKCCVRGHAAHSSLTPKGVNAIEYAARLICHIRDLADQMRAQGPFDEEFDVPFSTAQTGLVSGGIALNTVPSLCEFTFEYRNLPPVDPTGLFEQVEKYAREQLEPAMRAVQPHASIEFTQICAAPAFDGVEQEAITQLVRALTQNQVRRKVAYGTEAGLFQLAGVPSIVCGPGDIEQAHKPNEYVAIEQIEACESFTRKLIASLVTHS
ncbi:acetylornithine deacetylase [Burkholderia sp. L27(2015)]|uniref:acetylornithine deacetylase n=1 Tax=Burkholderia sp. L27(2015) TaxID=1641858 RepID=UPI00131A8531|nr:acetylornithine deacetylase [Burkholderia sp. L27(2015)]